MLVGGAQLVAPNPWLLNYDAPRRPLGGSLDKPTVELILPAIDDTEFTTESLILDIDD